MNMNEKLIKDMLQFAKVVVNSIEDTDITTLESLVISGAEWMYAELAKETATTPAPDHLEGPPYCRGVYELEGTYGDGNPSAVWFDGKQWWVPGWECPINTTRAKKLIRAFPLNPEKT